MPDYIIAALLLMFGIGVIMLGSMAGGIYFGIHASTTWVLIVSILGVILIVFDVIDSKYNIIGKLHEKYDIPGFFLNFGIISPIDVFVKCYISFAVFTWITVGVKFFMHRA